MAKESVGLKGTLGLAPKIAVKSSTIDIDKTEKDVKNIHSTKIELTRISVDMPKALFKKMKIKVAEDEMTVRDYVLKLIEEDLNK
ncbi:MULTISPECIES: hypothetical protein [unclassified Siphonobacter]|uniref:hypothetical protein n=1 Tax=unclassified Siphonobacter TaxID=2635712 RepID=UPI000CB9B97F|nr:MULTISPECIES: hypothetical protein [unclassified Siphonobacter]MDQ1088778.1 4-hydroxy-3-methylbut-2-en-1-yl diphosphate synthase IspG/GcpE [Siphonobacter sp. SORGH_AS_1065]MDR6194961.1 4-hydroxy-3-methylbut-2-en-1-yl diphosphate synthase IspG/GcpE [Siphonobacter sp. SORGH_AS_0500]PKK38494.1 hypothetical protein BWI96_01610 [Siphonobacter sp. SORGH_AS_0500]